MCRNLVRHNYNNKVFAERVTYTLFSDMNYRRIKKKWTRAAKKKKKENTAYTSGRSLTRAKLTVKDKVRFRKISSLKWRQTRGRSFRSVHAMLPYVYASLDRFLFRETYLYRVLHRTQGTTTHGVIHTNYLRPFGRTFIGRFKGFLWVEILWKKLLT